MFERMIGDLEYQRRNSAAGRAVAKMHGGKWEPFDPRIQPMLPSQRRPRGRSPVQTRFKRTDASRARDKDAWLARSAGMKYRAIRDLLGYRNHSSAVRAVARAHTEWLLGILDYTGPAPPAHLMPDVRIVQHLPKATRAGMRSCGCFLPKGQPVAYIGAKQVCLDHAMERAGISWGELDSHPEVIRKLRFRRLRFRKECHGTRAVRERTFTRRYPCAPL